MYVCEVLTASDVAHPETSPANHEPTPEVLHPNRRTVFAPFLQSTALAQEAHSCLQRLGALEVLGAAPGTLVWGEAVVQRVWDASPDSLFCLPLCEALGFPRRLRSCRYRVPRCARGSAHSRKLIRVRHDSFREVDSVSNSSSKSSRSGS